MYQQKINLGLNMKMAYFLQLLDRSSTDEQEWTYYAISRFSINLKFHSSEFMKLFMLLIFLFLLFHVGYCIIMLQITAPVLLIFIILFFCRFKHLKKEQYSLLIKCCPENINVSQKPPKTTFPPQRFISNNWPFGDSNVI